jgi:hypothetical protein
MLLSALPAQVVLQPKPPAKFFVELKSELKRSLKTIKSETKDRAESTVVLSIAILKTNPDGSLVAELKIESSKDAVTDEAGKRKESTATDLQGAAVQLTLDAGMNITRVDGIPALLAKLDPKGTAKAATKAYSAEHYETTFRFWAGQIFVPLGGKAVNTGDKWEQKTARTMAAYGNLRLTKTLIYGGKETSDGKELHRLTFTTAHAFAPLKAPDAFPFKVSRVSINKGVCDGTLYFDPVVGCVVRADCKELRELVMTLSYDALDREVRIRDEGTSAMRFHEKNPLP